jgi:hypothetical protein
MVGAAFSFPAFFLIPFFSTDLLEAIHLVLSTLACFFGQPGPHLFTKSLTASVAATSGTVPLQGIRLGRV